MTTRLSARPRGVSDPASEATSPRDQRRPGNSVLAASLAGAGVAPDLTQALEDCFGPGVASLRWHQGSAGEARTLGAEAWCEGPDVHLGGLRPQVDGQLDPQASFEQLWSGDAEEMERLLLLIRSESAGDEVMPHEWENAMEGRTDEAFLYTDPETGEERSYEQLGYLDLATRNDSHFSGPTMSGRDNNMRVYALLHEMALEEAQRQAQLPPGERDLDRLRAMESASMHYLTDRHASGHTFEKQGVMEASGYLDSSKWTWPGGALALDAIQGSGATANLFVKSVHDDWNERGVGVKDAKGDTWTAHGDGHWADAGNAENRRRTAGSVVTSFAELQGVLDGGAAPDAQSYGAFDTVPQWSFGRQRKAEEEAADRTFAGVAPEQLGDQAGGYLQWGLEEVGEGLTAPWEEMMQEWYRAEDYLRRGGDPGRLFGY